MSYYDEKTMVKLVPAGPHLIPAFYGKHRSCSRIDGSKRAARLGVHRTSNSFYVSPLRTVGKGSLKLSLVFIAQKSGGETKALSEEEPSPAASRPSGCINTHLHSGFLCTQQQLSLFSQEGGRGGEGFALHCLNAGRRLRPLRRLLMQRPNASAFLRGFPDGAAARGRCGRQRWRVPAVPLLRSSQEPKKHAQLKCDSCYFLC